MPGVKSVGDPVVAARNKMDPPLLHLEVRLIQTGIKATSHLSCLAHFEANSDPPENTRPAEMSSLVFWSLKGLKYVGVCSHDTGVGVMSGVKHQQVGWFSQESD